MPRKKKIETTITSENIDEENIVSKEETISDKEVVTEEPVTTEVKEETLMSEEPISEEEAPLTQEEVKEEVPGELETVTETKEEVTKEELNVESAEETTPLEFNETGELNQIDVSDENELNKSVNKARVEFKEEHDRLLKYNKVLGIVLFVAMIAILVVGLIYPDVVVYLLIGIAVYFVLVFALTRYQRRKMDECVKKYLNVYSLYTESYSYDPSIYKNVTIKFEEKLDREVVDKLAYVNDCIEIGSRNIVRYLLNGTSCYTGDVSIKTGEKKVRKTHRVGFVGKLVVMPYELKSEGRILCYLKGCGDATPNNLDDVNKIDVHDLSSSWEVYASNEDLKKVFTSSVVKALNAFSCDNILNDVLISFNEGSLLIGLSYSDDLMVIPLEKEFVGTSFTHFKEDMKLVADFYKSLTK